MNFALSILLVFGIIQPSYAIDKKDFGVFGKKSLLEHLKTQKPKEPEKPPEKSLEPKQYYRFLNPYTNQYEYFEANSDKDAQDYVNKRIEEDRAKTIKSSQMPVRSSTNC